MAVPSVDVVINVNPDRVVRASSAQITAEQVSSLKTKRVSRTVFGLLSLGAGAVGVGLLAFGEERTHIAGAGLLGCGVYFYKSCLETVKDCAEALKKIERVKDWSFSALFPWHSHTELNSLFTPEGVKAKFLEEFPNSDEGALMWQFGISGRAALAASEICQASTIR